MVLRIREHSCDVKSVFQIVCGLTKGLSQSFEMNDTICLRNVEGIKHIDEALLGSSLTSATLSC